MQKTKSKNYLFNTKPCFFAKKSWRGVLQNIKRPFTSLFSTICSISFYCFAGRRIYE